MSSERQTTQVGIPVVVVHYFVSAAASSPFSQAKKVKGRENWKPLSTSTIVAVENIMDIALL